MMARNTNVPFKGRIQKRKTNHLQIITFSLQRAAGPYSRVRTGHYPSDFEDIELEAFSIAHNLAILQRLRSSPKISCSRHRDTGSLYLLGRRTLRIYRWSRGS
jgi:hypothetical protein